MKTLLQFFQESNGRMSSTRLISVFGTFLIIGVWVYISVTKGALQSFDQSVVEVLGIVIAGKVIQKNIENKTPANG